ncbi:MAG TPA: IclR family transcriptional regulator [Zeimonas sp.]|nr:IclR family transcriptional regulator [Zeimonas sp.]
MSTRQPRGTKPSAAAGGDAAPGMVPAVERAVRLLDHLAGQRRPQPLADLSKALALPKSSLHGLLHTLVALGLATRTDRGEYALGAKPVQWAGAFGRQSGVVDAFDAAADQLPALREEAIMLAVLDGTEVLYLACRPGTRALAVNFRVGGRFPASCTSSGKALLATLPAKRVRELLGGRPLPRLTRHSVGSVAALLRQLERFRTQGFAVDDEETAEGMHCFGAPVFAAGRSDAVAAVAVSLIKASTSARRRDEVVTAIRDLAARVSHRLGA